MDIFLKILDGITDFIQKVGFLNTVFLVLLLDRVGLFKWAYQYLKNKQKKEEKEDHPHRRLEDAEGHTHRRIETEFDQFKKDVDERIDDVRAISNTVKMNLDYHLEQYKKHMELYGEEAVRMERMESDIKSVTNEMKIQNGHIFSQNKSLFENLAKLDEKFDKKFDDIMKAIVANR